MLYLGSTGPVPEENYAIPIGKAEIKREGTDVTILATQLMVSKALSAAAAKEFKGDKLPFDRIEFVRDGKAIRFDAAEKTWVCDLLSYSCVESKESPTDDSSRTGENDAASGTNSPLSALTFHTRELSFDERRS